MSEERLELHLTNAREIRYNPDDKYVIFSDLHMGNGHRRDDFSRNANLFRSALSEHYLPKGYKLILNGDVEDLHKFTWRAIRNYWTEIYEVFDEFNKKGSLYKTVGNHDSRFLLDLRDQSPYKMDTVLRISGLEYPILVYHGHQVSAFYEKFNDISRFGLRYLAMPLGIMNYSVAHDSRKRHALEKRIYDYSRQEQIVSVIGHTHRPLFESLTMAESLRFRIEQLLGQYRKASDERKHEIEVNISELRQYLVSWRSRKKRPDLQSGIYEDEDVPVPCMFNSGTVMGKRGVTGLEIYGGSIRLVHWFDERVAPRYVSRDVPRIVTLPQGNIHRRELRKASLGYVMDCLRLLT